jgi:hypothetical protein
MFRIASGDCVLRLRRTGYQLWAPLLLSCIVLILPPIWVIVIGAVYMRVTDGFAK